MQQPYLPSRLYKTSSYIYLFEPSTVDAQTQRLRSVDASAKIVTSNFAASTISGALPFLRDNTPFTTLLAPDNSITAVSGGCNSQDDTQIWQFRPDGGGNGSWSQQSLTASSDFAANGYLAAGMAFARKSNSNASSILVFGGMCPDNSTQGQSWTADAAYSNSLAQYTQASTSGSPQQYTASTLIAQGQPIAEAGFTITPLAASVTPGSGDTAQNFILLGGHTKSAFINMSQVAVFSMPHASWTFLPVQQLQDSRTDLVLRDAAQIDPRSGHSAVLTEDGSKIIILGGWVGDVNTPAQPQLAVLEIGNGFGGSGSWQWTAPSLTGSGLAANTGIYGHGAVMLSDGIMLVHGGYSIGSSSSRVKRAASSQTLLFNTTSNAWITTYSPPAGNAVGGSVQASSTSSDSLAQKIGLAVGLTLGLLILIGLLGFYFWYNRRLRKRASQQGRNLESRSSDGSVAVFSQPFLEKHSIDGRGGDMAALNHYWMSSGRPDMQPMQQNSATTGLYVDIPSPTRGLRKGNAARNYQYHAAPRYNDNRTSRGSSGIHPIAEMDGEDLVDHDDDALMSEAQRQLKEVEKILQGNRKASLNTPNPLRSHPVSPEGLDKEPDQTSPTISKASPPKWRLDALTHADASGRLSPTKTDERTSSTLSEASQRSIMSNNSITRTMSTRTGRMLAAAAAAHVRAKAVESEAASSSDARTSTMSTDGGHRTPHELGRSSTAGSSASGARSAGAESFRTARSTAGNEGDALLSSVDHDDPYRRARMADGRTSAYDPPTRRRTGILGSLRRAIGVMATDRTLSLVSSKGGAEQEPISALSSPTKERRDPARHLPRRTVSDGGVLLRQKRGKQDWTDNQWAPYTDDPDPGDWGHPYRTSAERRRAEEDWDVEDAVTKRDVQVMFTVPKSRLRVVNADADRASIRSVSDGALSRSGSVRVLASTDSHAVLAVLGEEDPK